VHAGRIEIGQESRMQRLDLILPAWGSRLDDALRMCVGSLAAPNNLPKVANARLIIVTQPEDVDRVRASDEVALAAQTADVEIVQFPDPAVPRYRMLARGHLIGSMISSRDNALAMFLCADNVTADGALPRLVDIAKSWKFMLATPWGVSHEKVAASIEEHRNSSRLIVNDRTLAGWCAKFPAPQFQTWNIDSESFGLDFPVCSWRRVCDDGILAFSIWQHPMMMNFARVEHYDARGLEFWTFDLDHASRNARPEECFVVPDSDVYLAAYLTSKDAWQPPPKRWRNGSTAAILTEAVNEPNFVDDLKRTLFGKTLYRIHGSSLDSRWMEAERGTKELLRDVFVNPTVRFDPPPTLAESLDGFNIVIWRRRFYIVPHVLGPVDVFEIASAVRAL